MFRSRGKFTGGVCRFSAGLGKVRSGLLQSQGAAARSTRLCKVGGTAPPGSSDWPRHRTLNPELARGYDEGNLCRAFSGSMLGPITSVTSD